MSEDKIRKVVTTHTLMNRINHRQKRLLESLEHLYQNRLKGDHPARIELQRAERRFEVLLSHEALADSVMFGKR